MGDGRAPTEAKRVADGDDGVPNTDRRRIPELHRRQPAEPLDLKHRDISGWVRANDAGIMAPVARDHYGDRVGTLYYVVVGDDHAVWGDHHSSAGRRAASFEAIEHSVHVDDSGVSGRCYRGRIDRCGADRCALGLRRPGSLGTGGANEGRRRGDKRNAEGAHGSQCRPLAPPGLPRPLPLPRRRCYGSVADETQLLLVPGGIGVVEGALALTLMGAGLRHPVALAAVLIYRLISFWMVISVGWLIYFLGPRTGHRGSPRTAAPRLPGLRGPLGDIDLGAPVLVDFQPGKVSGPAHERREERTA